MVYQWPLESSAIFQAPALRNPDPVSTFPVDLVVNGEILYANHEWSQVDTNDYGRFFETCLKSSDEAINFLIFSVFSLLRYSKPTSM